MAITFPGSPGDGAIYTNPTTGVKYIYNATDDVWRTHIWPTNTDYLQLSGGTLTGNLSLGTNDLTAQDINSTTLTTTAGVTVGNGLTVSDGNVVMAAGHGIDFHAYATSGNPSTNLLDDYEEGTWTPVFDTSISTGSLTNLAYQLQGGRYIKVGTMVYVEGKLQTSSVTNSTNGTYDISGLPFPAANTDLGSLIHCFSQHTWTEAPHFFDTVNNTNHARARQGITVGGTTYVNGNTNDFNTTSGNRNRVYFSGWYEAA